MALQLPVIADQSVIKQFEELIERTSFGATTGTKAGNFDAQWIEFTSSATPDDENTIAHKLSRVPTGYLIGQKDKAGDLYNGTTAWTAANIYLKSDVASVTFRILVW